VFYCHTGLYLSGSGVYPGVKWLTPYEVQKPASEANYI